MDIVKEFEDYLQMKDRAELTIKGYLGDIKRFQEWFQQSNGEVFCLESTTPTDIREYRQFLKVVERRKASTINRKLAALSILMQWAILKGYIESDPTENIHPIKKENPGPRYLDKKEQFALQRAIEKDLQFSRLRFPKRWLTRLRDASLVTFLLHTGLRLNEALSLDVKDIQSYDHKGRVLVREGKGNKERLVPLNNEARKALETWTAVRPNHGTRLWIPTEDKQSDGLSSRSVERVLSRIGKEAGLDHLTPHVLRHTFAKNLVESGVGLEKVAALLGHSSLNTTRIYITPNSRDLEQAVRTLEPG